jgi:kynurenine 3-monooxygenase
MRAGVTSKLVQFRKAVEEFLSDKMPSTGFATQYSRVSFSNQRYSEVIRAVELQKRILLQGMIASALVPVLSYAVWATWRVHHGRGTRDILGSISQRIGRILSKWW